MDNKPEPSPIMRSHGAQIETVNTLDFYSVADNLPTLCWVAYADGGIFWYNRRWYEYTGTSPTSQQGWG